LKAVTTDKLNLIRFKKSCGPFARSEPSEIGGLLFALLGAASAFAPPHMARLSQSSVRMMAEKEAPAKKAKKEAPPPKPKLPGEGDPFSPEALAYSEKNRDGGSAFQPRGISDATVIDKYQPYIENDDEPWHATCKGSVVGLDTLSLSKPAAVVEVEEANPPKPGGATPGWTGKRAVASTHDNSR